MSIVGDSLQIGWKSNSVISGGRDSDLSQGPFGGNSGGMHASGIGGVNGLLAHFTTRMKFINFEMKNKETNLALRGPNRDSYTT